MPDARPYRLPVRAKWRKRRLVYALWSLNCEYYRRLLPHLKYWGLITHWVVSSSNSQPPFNTTHFLPPIHPYHQFIVYSFSSSSRPLILYFSCHLELYPPFLLLAPLSYFSPDLIHSSPPSLHYIQTQLSYSLLLVISIWSSSPLGTHLFSFLYSRCYSIMCHVLTTE